MIPIQLTIEGLYSYQERQTIDFTNLIDAGLFGIFGAVGSGKSSILEAITFALFGETERLNARDKRAYNMMNLKSNRSYIEFDFINFENKIFRATRDFKRNSKRFDDVKSPVVVFSEQINGQWIPLNHSNAEEILGLSYSNFKRTIIIPQGQFKEFIELGATERTKMMKEIFNLHHYDLQDKVAVLAKKNQSNLDQLDGKLSGFEEVSEEKIKELEVVLSDQEKSQIQAQSAFETENENFQRLKVLKADFEILTTKKIALAQMTDKKSVIDQQKIELDRFELVYKSFHQLLIDLDKVEAYIKAKTLSKENELKQLALIQNQMEELKQQIHLIQADFENLPQKRQEESDLEIIARTIHFTKEVEVLKERTKNGVLKVEEVKLKEKAIATSIQNSEMELKELMNHRVDPQILMEISEWFTQNLTIKKTLEQQQSKVVDIQKKVDELNHFFQTKNITIETFEALFTAKFQALEIQRKALESEKNEFEVKQKIAHYAHELHDGQPCPLCGSESHPNVVETEDVALKIQSSSEKIAGVESEIKLLQQEQIEHQKLIHQHQLLSTQLVDELAQISTLNNQLAAHLVLFRWEGYDATNSEDFGQKKQAILAVEKKIISIQNEISSQRELVEIERVNTEKFQKALEEFKVEEAQKLAQITANQTNLKSLSWNNFSHFSLEEIHVQLENLQAKNNQIETNYTSYTKELTELNLKLASQMTSIELAEKQIQELNQGQEQLLVSINEQLKLYGISSIEDVKSTLDLRLDVVVIRQQIEDFKIEFETLKNVIQELESKLANVSYNEELFVAAEEKLNLVLSQLKEANDLVTKSKTEILRLQTAFEAKKDLLKELEQLQKRAFNLQTLRNMFSAAGFVQYVSSIYLKQLCENANVRFHRMTRNQLSLQINENNDFEIVDFLNEGRSRSVKTLSGGQSFQVSLSLALALAESVQASTKADRNFFFIDEGFGTQDAEAVNIVFETLNNLHKENRIVGIISHVEELKERIPMALNIVKDEEKGSQITVV